MAETPKTNRKRTNPALTPLETIPADSVKYDVVISSETTSGDCGFTETNHSPYLPSFKSAMAWMLANLTGRCGQVGSITLLAFDGESGKLVAQREITVWARPVYGEAVKVW